MRQIAVFGLELGIVLCQGIILKPEPVAFFLTALEPLLKRGDGVFQVLVLRLEVGIGGGDVGELLVGLFEEAEIAVPFRVGLVELGVSRVEGIEQALLVIGRHVRRRVRDGGPPPVIGGYSLMERHGW